MPVGGGHGYGAGDGHGHGGGDGTVDYSHGEVVGYGHHDGVTIDHDQAEGHMQPDHSGDIAGHAGGPHGASHFGHHSISHAGHHASCGIYNMFIGHDCGNTGMSDEHGDYVDKQRHLAPGVNAAMFSVDVSIPSHGYISVRNLIAEMAGRAGLVSVHFHKPGLRPFGDHETRIPEELTFFNGDAKKFAGWYPGIAGQMLWWQDFFQIGSHTEAENFWDELKRMFGQRPGLKNVFPVKGFLGIRGATACYHGAFSGQEPGVYETIIQIQKGHFEVEDRRTGKSTCDAQDFSRHAQKAEELGIKLAAGIRARPPDAAALARHESKRKAAARTKPA